jgi:hypothetical protein
MLIGVQSAKDGKVNISSGEWSKAQSQDVITKTGPLMGGPLAAGVYKCFRIFLQPILAAALEPQVDHLSN